jgi:hypothetical protein
MKDLLFIIAVDQTDLLPDLSREFAREGVAFVVDRRHDGRRRMKHGIGDERRIQARRQWSISEMLDDFGFAVVPNE